MCKERSRKQFSSLCRCCEARASVFKSQERSGKQFSPLLRSCSSCKPVSVRKTNVSQSRFNRRECGVKVGPSCLSAGKV